MAPAEKRDLAAQVAESRARCGLPPKVADVTALRRLAGLFHGDVSSAKVKRIA